MKTTEKFENGLSIVQLEERYEMATKGEREKIDWGGDDMRVPDLPSPDPTISL